MKKLLKCLGSIFFGITIFMSSMNISKAAISSEDDFSILLKTHNISVSNTEVSMSYFELSGLVDGTNQNNIYSDVLSSKDEIIKVTSEDILKLHYYSLTPEEQTEFLLEASNQVVDVQSEKGIILISYNLNYIGTNTSINITSSRTGTLRMQDPVTGVWGSAEVTLTGYFTYTYGTPWTIYQGTYDYYYNEYSSLPLHISTHSVSTGGSYSSSGNYIGNEISCSSWTQAVCSFNESTLYIYVYPNSSYNYARIG